MNTCTAAVVFAEGFEEIEAMAPVDILRRAGVNVKVTGVTSMEITGAHGVKMAMDCVVGELSAEELDLVVLPGGIPGSANLAASSEVKQLFNAMNAQNKLIAAICAAPMALEAYGVINGRRVTCYPGVEEKLVSAIHTGNRVEVDGNVITSMGPGTAMDFSYELLRQLGLSDKAAQLAKGMLVE